MTHRLKVLRGPSLALALLVLLLSLSAFGATSASAHSDASLTAQVRIVVNGKAYYVTQGHVLTLPTTFSDGSRGWITFSASASQAQAALGGGTTPYTTVCRTAYATQSGYNIYGNLLYSYTLSQYWCWDGSSITQLNVPGDSYTANLGWSLANESHQTVYFDGWHGTDWGTWRFNGPFGIGCKSGRNVIDFYGDGTATDSFNTNSYYGC